MRKLFTSLLMLAALLSSTQAWAQSLTVAGVSVNLNATSTQTITGSNISGTVTYNPSSKTLYLNGATINGSISGRNLGSSGSDRFFIHLTGYNTIKSSNNGMRFDDSYVVLYGNAGSQLNINTSESTTDYADIDAEGGHFEVWSIRLILSGKAMGFWGNPSKAELEFVNSMVTISSDSEAIHGFKTVRFDDCKCTTTGATFQSGTGFVNSSGTVLKSLQVWPFLTVGDEPVRTASNATSGSKYSWKWTKSTKTLEITGNISAASYRGIRNVGIDGLTIKAEGTYTISSNWSALQAEANTTISGGGSLRFDNGTSTQSSQYGIEVVGNQNITVKMNELIAFGNHYGIYNPSGTLTLEKYSDGCTYKFAGATSNVYVKNLVMNNMDISTGSSYWNASDGYTYYQGEIAKGTTIGYGTWFMPTSAISYYDLWVGGTHVKQSNTQYIYSPYITAGKVTYNNSSKTLTLDGVTMNVTDDTNYCIWTGSALGDLTVNLTGSNKLTSNATAVGLNSNATFSGSGNMTMTSKSSLGISGMGSHTKLTIENTSYFQVSAKASAIYANSSEVVLKKATSDTFGYSFTTSSDDRAIRNVKTLTLDNMDFFFQDDASFNTPGCYFDASAYSVLVNGGAYAKKVSFMSIKEKLPIYICGKQLNRVSTNNSDVIEVGSKYISSGTQSVCYNPSTKTLTLNDATINVTGDNPSISSEVAGLIINATGTNNITASGTGLNLGGGGTVTLTGSGDLNVTSTGHSAISVYSSTGLTLQRSGGTTKFMGASYGYYGLTNTNLTINKDASNGALYEFAGKNGDIYQTGFVLGTGVKIHSKWTWFNETEKSMYRYGSLVKTNPSDIESNGTWIRGDVTWEEYPIYIAGTQLYGAIINGDVKGNAGGFCNKYCTTEGVSYNPNTKTLTLNGATISSDQHVVKSEANQLTINVKGTNKLTSTAFYGIWQYRNGIMTFTGDGSLETTGAGIGLGPWAGSSEVVIEDNVKLIATGSKYGIGAENGANSNGKLSVGGNAVVKASSIGRLSAITLNDNQTIVEPMGAVIKSQSYGYDICVGDDIAQNVVIQKVIEKYGLAVFDIDVDANNKDDILSDGGTFKYDPNTKRLTITDADVKLTNNNYAAVTNKSVEGLNIYVSGDNNFVSTSSEIGCLFELHKNTTFSGTGSVTGKSLWGILSPSSTCTLSGPLFKFNTRYGVAGTSPCNLIVDSGYLLIEPLVSDATILSLSGLTLGTGMIIAEPKGGKFNASLKGITVDGSNVYRGRTLISRKGDVNLDGDVTIADGVAVLNAMADYEVPGDPDVNGDGEKTIADFVAVLNIMAQ